MTTALAATAANASFLTGNYSFSFSSFQTFLNRKDCRSPKTKNIYVNNLKQFAAWLKYSMVMQPQEEDIIAYRNWLSKEHEAIQLEDSARGWSFRRDSNGNKVVTSCGPATVKLYLQSVKQLFKWTASAGIYPNVAELVAMPRIDSTTHRKEALLPSQVLEVEEAIDTTAAAKLAEAGEAVKDTTGRKQRATEQGLRLKAMYLLAVNAGLRTIELSRANVKDLTVINGTAYLYIWGKGHSEADTRKPLAREVYMALQDYLASRSDKAKANSPLFVSTGNRSKGKRIASTTISTMLKQALREAGIDSDRITAHSLRHTAGNSIMDITQDNVYKAQQYMRHASPQTTEIYLHRNTEAMDAVLAADLYSYYHGSNS